jgi:MFS family permease
VLIGQNFFYGAVYYSNIYYIPLYTQNVLGETPIISGLLLAPIVICQSIASTCSGLYISKRKRYGEVIWVGFTLWTLGAGLFCLFDQNINKGAIVVIEMLVGLGTGMVFQPTLIAMQAHCRKSQRAVVISNRNFIRSMGGAVGLAISAAVLQNSLKQHLPDQFKYLATSTYSSPDYSKYSPADAHAIRDAYSQASHTVFIVFVPFMGVCLLTQWFVKDEGLTRPDEKPTGAEKTEKAEETAGGTVTGPPTQLTREEPEEHANADAHAPPPAAQDQSRRCNGEGSAVQHDENGDTDKDSIDDAPHLQHLDSQDHSNLFIVRTMSRN